MSIANLGFAIDSSGAKGAAVDLDNLVSAAQRAEKAEQGVGRASREAQSGIRSLATAVKSLTEAESRMGAGFAQKRAQDIAAYGAELDRLRAKFNPIFAASKQYETSLDELNRAHRVGAIGTREYEDALERLNAEFAMVQSGAMRGAAGLNVANAAMSQSSGMSRNLMFQMVDLGQTIPLALQSPTFALQNMGFQVAQIGQLYFGQGGMRAALRDMASMAASAGRAILRGASSMAALAAANPVAAGAIAAASVVIGGFVTALFRADRAAEKYAESLGEIRAATDDLRGFSDLSSDLDALRDKYGEVTAEVRNLIEAQRNLALEQQRRAAQEQLGAMREFAGEMAADTLAFNPFDFTRDDFRTMMGLRPFLDAIEQAEGFKAQADAVARMREHLEASPDLVEAMGDKAHDFRAMIISAEDALRQAAVEAGEVESTVDDAASGARLLSGNIADASRNASHLANELQRGMAAMAGMAQSAQDQLAETEIQLRFRGDPVAQARALAQRETGQEIAEQQRNAAELGIPSGLVDPLLDPMKEKARATVEALAEVAQRRVEIANLNKPPARASGGGGSSAISEAAREAEERVRELERLRQAYDGIVASGEEFIAHQQMEQQALGMTEEAANRMRIEHELFNRALQAGIELTPQQAEELRRLAGEMAGAEERTATMTERFREMEERIAFANETATGFFTSFRDQLIEGASIWDALKSAATRALDAIMQKMDEMMQKQGGLFGGGSSGGGGGIFGSILNGVLGIGSAAFGGFGAGSFQTAGGFGAQNIAVASSAANAAGGGLFTPSGSVALPSFHTGGEFEVGGRGGIDQNLVSFWASRGERVRVTPANDRTAPEGRIVVNGGMHFPNVRDRDTAREAAGSMKRRLTELTRKGAGYT